MNPLALLGSSWSTLFGAVLLGMALGGSGAWKVQNWRHEAQLAKLRQQAETQAAANRDLQRSAELHYTVEAQTRDRFIVTTVKEIHDASASLAACPVPAAARRLLNAAGACADPAATCGAGDPVRPAR